MTDTENTKGSSSGVNGLKLVGWVVLGVIALIVIGSIILFILKVVLGATLLALAALVGWFIWLWLKRKWEHRNQY